MKKIPITNQPAIHCPVLKKYRLVSKCQKCDFFRGVTNIQKDGDISAKVKCDVKM